MRVLILFFFLITSILANDTVTFFNKSSENRLLCHLGQYSFMMVSQKNSVIKNIDGHIYFHMKQENLYFLSNSCQIVKDSKNKI